MTWEDWGQTQQSTAFHWDAWIGSQPDEAKLYQPTQQEMQMFMDPALVPETHPQLQNIRCWRIGFHQRITNCLLSCTFCRRKDSMNTSLRSTANCDGGNHMRLCFCIPIWSQSRCWHHWRTLGNCIHYPPCICFDISCHETRTGRSATRDPCTTVESQLQPHHLWWERMLHDQREPSWPAKQIDVFCRLHELEQRWLTSLALRKVFWSDAGMCPLCNREGPRDQGTINQSSHRMFHWQRLSPYSWWTCCHDKVYSWQLPTKWPSIHKGGKWPTDSLDTWPKSTACAIEAWCDSAFCSVAKTSAFCT